MATEGEDLMTDWCARGHLLVSVTTDEGEVLVHVFEADATECANLDQFDRE